MNKYEDLLNIIDSLRAEAPVEYKRYHPEDSRMGMLENARSRAFIHLFLKVKFGLTGFLEREQFITDGPQDGGIDAYYVDSESKVLYFIQSKFRNTDANFENKEIALSDLLSMEIRRVLDGEYDSEAGDPYNDKIKGFIDNRIQHIPDMPRYRIEVVLLANVKQNLKPKLSKLTGGFQVNIYNFDRVYSELVFPLVSGSYYNIKELKITINVDRESAGHRIQYYPMTQYGECTVNVLFVPTIEIARILFKYKNSILRYNPRSYLDLQSGSINSKIASSITDIETNEFALFNNGITMLSDETEYSDKVGKKNKAEVLITNPQIINGGQTAYTLSILYEELVAKGRLSEFDGKDVLLKIISFDSGVGEDKEFEIQRKRLELIEKISVATNQQSPVTEADRRANDKVQIELQEYIYRDFGLFYERKRGEFGDGIRSGYIHRRKIIDRELFIRICLAVQNNPRQARSGSVANFFEKSRFDDILPDSSNYRKYVYAYMAFERIASYDSPSLNTRSNARMAITCVVANGFDENTPVSEFETRIAEQLTEVIGRWPEFEEAIRKNPENMQRYFKEKQDEKTGDKIIETNWTAYYKGRTLLTDLKNFFGF